MPRGRAALVVMQICCGVVEVTAGRVTKQWREVVATDQECGG